MITTDIIQTTASVLGVIVAALGFYGVFRQLRKSSHSDIYELGIAIKQALLKHPSLRRYFFDGDPVDVEDETERNRVLILADMYCLYLEQIAIYADDLGGEKEAWNGYICEMYRKSPAIREYLRSTEGNRNKSYDRELFRVIDTECNTAPVDEQLAA